MSTEQEKILDKIEKLINKSKSAKDIGSLAEAEAFMSKARNLLLEYNLSIDHIESRKKKDDYTIKDFHVSDLVNVSSNDGTSWVKNLLNIITKFNMCNMVVYNNSNSYCIIGTEVNINICINLAETMIPVFLNLCRNRFKEYSSQGGDIKKNKFRRDYLTGVVLGIYKKYKEEEEEMMSSQNDKQIQIHALIRTNQVELINKTNEFIKGDIKEHKPKVIKVNDATEIGKTDGRSYKKDKFIEKT